MSEERQKLVEAYHKIREDCWENIVSGLPDCKICDEAREAILAYDAAHPEAVEE